MCRSISGHFSKMWTIYISVFTIWPLLAGAENNYVYSNGWIPVSSDTVYDQYKRESIQVTPYAPTHNIQVINTDINKVLSSQNKLNMQEEISDDIEINSETFQIECDTEFSNCENEEIKNNNGPTIELDFVPNVFKSKENDTDKETVRRSKKVAYFDLKHDVKHLNQDKLPTGNNDQTYEVTEESDSKSMFESEESGTEDAGYKYEPPHKENLTSGLFEILSKYKINKDDELPNYFLSRQQKARLSLKQNLPIKPLHKQFYYKYNNLNHLPVDPLLAVFLSNYGYYLQGMYGIQNQYNNLYGYLASNNIHNNRPFGFYKVFSDTDSSQ